jgi:hypothetical protein
MELTGTLVGSAAETYTEEEPLYTVEAQHVEDLPGAFASGEFGKRDADWVVRWYFRRYLGDYPDRDRRAMEEAFGDNGYEALQSAVGDAVQGTGLRDRLEPLLALSGVDVRVASAFLFFIDPDLFAVVDDRQWAVLRAAGELDGAYPDPPTVEDYETYLAAYRRVADRLDCDTWTLYRALWRLGDDV